MFRLALLFILGSFYSVTLLSQHKFTVKKDLSEQWQVFSNNSFVGLAENTGPLTSVHFTIHANQYPAHELLVQSARPFFIFINGRLVKTGDGMIMLNLDSVAGAHGQTLSFSIRQKHIHLKDLKTQIIDRHAREDIFADATRPQSFFRDFVVLAGLVLTVFFVSMLKAHPKLAADYFSMAKILSLREVEDNQSHVRFAISANLLFYVFCSLMLGFCLTLLFPHLPDDFLLPLYFKATTFGQAVLQWLKLSFIILIVLFCKIALVFLLSALFGLRGIAGMHFFNWVRLLLLTSCGLSAIVFVYFIWRGSNEYVYVTTLSVIVAVLIAWVAIGFLKLNNRSEHSMFHLFSYICATEVIPLLIMIKVLFN